MWRVFSAALRRRLADLRASATAAERVRAALVETLPAGDPSMTAVSGRLATSARTLQRQLGQEGTSFQVILARAREDFARHYLAREDLWTSEIAFLLGYSDTNSFYRANAGPTPAPRPHRNLPAGGLSTRRTPVRAAGFGSCRSWWCRRGLPSGSHTCGCRR